MDRATQKTSKRQVRKPQVEPLTRDPLTGLFQQDYLFQQIGSYLRKGRRQEIEATLALLQLENFYEIRTWVGKSEASLLLSDLVKRVRRSLPKGVLLCRCARFEFGLLLLHESSVNAALITGRIKLAIQSAASTAIPPQLELICGIGMAHLDRSIPTADVVFARARHKLSLSYYQAEDEQPVALSSPLGPEQRLTALRSALKQNQLKLSFQASPSLKPDGLRHFEVRSCLKQEQAAMSISSLFEAAAQNALGEAIDRWCIESILRRLANAADPSLRFTLNLTQCSLVSTVFFTWLEERLEHYRAQPQQLQFQVSEIDVLIAQHHMEVFCGKLEALKIKLAVSNFGCTTNPFRYLSLLRLTTVKLHVSLLKKVNVNRDCQQQLLSTVSRLQERGIVVVAGMVDDIALLPTLWRCNVNQLQGYSLHRPSEEPSFSFLKPQTLFLRSSLRGAQN